MRSWDINPSYFPTVRWVVFGASLCWESIWHGKEHIIHLASKQTFIWFDIDQGVIRSGFPENWTSYNRCRGLDFFSNFPNHLHIELIYLWLMWICRLLPSQIGGNYYVFPNLSSQISPIIPPRLCRLWWDPSQNDHNGGADCVINIDNGIIGALEIDSL